ncbi:MAG: DUF4097 domain-containing protein [Blastocatellales bacterium]
MKMSKMTTLLGILMICLACGTGVAAQDFQQTYGLGAGGTVSVKNVSGNITVTGYNGNQIQITAWKEGRDRDQISIEDQSSGNTVSVRAKYPDNCNCNASVRFEVRVPNEISYRYNSISSVSGSISISNVMGDLNAKSVSGGVSVNGITGKTNVNSVSGSVTVGAVNGTVNAKSVSGDVKVEINRLAGAEDMDFSSVSGDVHVKLPGNLNANVKMSTMSGDLRTDFPITVEEPRYGPGRRAQGTVGSGERSLKISTISGSIHLLRS